MKAPLTTRPPTYLFRLLSVNLCVSTCMRLASYSSAEPVIILPPVERTHVSAGTAGQGQLMAPSPSPAAGVSPGIAAAGGGGGMGVQHQQPAALAGGPAQGMMAGGMVYGYAYPGEVLFSHAQVGATGQRGVTVAVVYLRDSISELGKKE